ncbi:hypothetical protein B0H66DRAFT_602289 [Apodospora peruviana]|uniref:Uncharacterized protein n=1 Tax=Apodospora peruviana TaxID=516989 RepID=A0AAE0M8J5_9PEZI|nr:hypothetical protein B0H66DRAFT_602289 [Apodospora peruviana]
MASGLEILGGIAAAAQLANLVGNVIANFGTRQNAPRQIKRLERIIEDLSDDHLIRTANERERERLWDLILTAERTVRDNTARERPNKLLRFFWPEDAEEQLKSLNDEIQSELIALGLRVDRRHRQSQGSIGLPGQALPTFSDNARPSSIQQRQIRPSYNSVEVPPEQSIPQSPSASGGRTAPPKPYKLPATLYLQASDGTNVVGPLEVKYLHVLERDESTRLIHYERKTANRHLVVTHRIPRSCLRFEDDKLDDLRVCFLDAHPITVVQSGKGHEVYFLHAKYEFGSVEQREEFIFRMLERKLLGRFYAEEIRYRNQLHAQDKVIRLWRKTEESRTGQPRVATKLTFLAREEKQWEWDLDRFTRFLEVLDGDRGVILHESDHDGEIKAGGRASVVIKFRPPPPPPKKRRNSSWARRFSATLSPTTPQPPPDSPSEQSAFKLDLVGKEHKDGGAGGGIDDESTKSDAERFKEVFQRYHPLATPHFTPLLPPIISAPPGGWGPLSGIDLDIVRHWFITEDGTDICSRDDTTETEFRIFMPTLNQNKHCPGIGQWKGN